MKRIFLIVFIILFAFIGKSQVYQVMPQYGYDVKRMKFDSTLQIPTFCGVPTLRSNILNKAAIAYDSCNKRFYFYDPALAVWDTIMGGGSSLDTTSLSNRINAKADSNIALQKVLNNGNIAYNEEIDLYDTTNGKYRELYLTPNSGNIPLIGMVDTSDRYLVLQTSSAYNTPSIYFQNKAKTQYLLQQDSIGGYVFLPTQSGGLDTLATSKDVRNSSFDSTSLSNRINTKLTASDTTGHWVNNITRTLGKDSIIYYIGSTRYAIKDSIGVGNGRFGNDTATIVMAKIHNNSGSTLTNGEVVYLATSGTNADVPSVMRANNKADSTSANTFGFVTGSISNNDTGYIILSGKIEKLNTAAFSNGDIIYLDSISGKWTKSKPKAPYHLVYLGVVIKANAGNGSIFVKCQNGYELDEIHDVQINSISNNQIIVYSDTQKVWKNRSAYSVIDTSGLSGRINLKLSISDTASMLSSFVHYQDTASLSTRINAKQNTLTNPVTGTGTTGAISKFTGTSTIGNATVDVDYLQQDMSMVAYQAMGSNSMKAYNLSVPNISSINLSYNTITSGLFLLYAVYIPKTTTITGVRWFQTVQGNYTANNYNGVALYSVSGSTLTRVDSSANDGNIWKTSSNTWGSKAFSNTYSAAAGIYYIGMLYSSSAQTTTPGFGATTISVNANVKTFDFTNNLKPAQFQSSITILPTTISAGSTTASSNNVALYLY